MNSTDAGVGTVSESQEASEKPKLTLDVQVEKPSACERNISVTISEADVKRYFHEACSSMVPKVAVPGFRAGRAPRKLVEQRFRKDLAEQVKGSLLLDAMTQVTEDQDFSAISEPDFDYSVVEVPESGPMTFQFKLEVRPEFDPPNWKGLPVERPVRSITSKDVDQELERVLSAESDLEDITGPVAADDLIVANLTFEHDGKVLTQLTNELIAVRRDLTFSDAVLADFAKLVTGANVGDHRQGTVTVGFDAPNDALRGKDVKVDIEIISIQRPGPVKISQELLESLKMESEGELRDFIESRLKLQQEYYQQQRMRQQITGQLTKDANWELPPDLVRRQARRELDRAVLELQRSGFNNEQIRAQRNELRRNSQASTERSLKEHFILERIAEDLNIDATAEDYRAEIEMIAKQSDMSVRATRAYIERNGMSDALRNQIVERKVIELITSEAKISDVPFEPTKSNAESIEHFVGGGSDAFIPSAKHAGDQQELRQPTDYT